MTPIPAKVLTVDKQSSQYRVLVQIELEKYLGSFHTLRFGEKKPFTGTCFHGQLDLFYYRDPRRESRQVVPAVDDYVTLVTHPLAHPVTSLQPINVVSVVALYKRYEPVKSIQPQTLLDLVSGRF